VTVKPEGKRFRLILWTREPVRKFRFLEPLTEGELLSVQNVIGRPNGKVFGLTTGGNYLVVPTDNVGYIEAVEL